MRMRRIGILGGTFDPIHRGHTDAAEAAHDALDLTRVLVIPAHIPPHRPQPFVSAYHRFAMAALAVSGRPGWGVSDQELRHDAPSYTSATLRRFHDRGYVAGELFFLIGADAFVDIASWNNYPAILGDAHFVVVSRPGYPVVELADRLPSLASRMVWAQREEMAQADPSIILIHAETADVSSTVIRRHRAEGQPVTGMVDPNVQQHIEHHGLYTPAVPGRRPRDERPVTSAGRMHGQD
jgi:nicotinate-nucleotide adenylyltransferase